MGALEPQLAEQFIRAFDGNPRIVEFAQRWPRTTRALMETYCQDPSWAVGLGRGRSGIGYFSFALRRMEDRARALYPRENLDHRVLDLVAAGEFRYHWGKRTAIRRLGPFWTAALWNLVEERPEKIQAAQRRLGLAVGQFARATWPALTELSTVIRSSCGGHHGRGRRPVAIGEILRHVPGLSGSA